MLPAGLTVLFPLAQVAHNLAVRVLGLPFYPADGCTELGIQAQDGVLHH